MGSHITWIYFYHNTFLCNDSDRIWKILQIVYVYSNILYPLAAAAGESTQSTSFTFIKSYAGVCLEGAIIVLSCIIISAFASSPPVVDTSASAVAMIWSYIGELIFNMLVLVGTIKMSDRIVREMIELQFSSHAVTTYVEILLELIIIYILGNVNYA